MMNPNVIKSLLLVLLSILPVIVVKFYPVVDWVSEPIYVYFMMLPILLIEIGLLIIIFKEKAVNSMLIVQLILTLILYLIMAYYLKVH